MKLNSVKKSLVALGAVLLLQACTDVVDRVNIYDQKGSSWNPVKTSDTVITVKADTVESKNTIVDPVTWDTITTWKKDLTTTTNTTISDTIRAAVGAIIQNIDVRRFTTNTTVTLLDTVITLKYIAPITFRFDSTAITAPGSSVTLNVNTGSSTIVFMHFGIANAKIASAALVTPDKTIELFVDSTSVDLMALPGSAGVKGDKGILKLTLAGLVQGKSITLTELTAANESQRTLEIKPLPALTVK